MSEVRYTDQHEWIRLDGDEATVGITKYAAEALGDVVFVELPAVGDAVKKGESFGVVESVKAVSELFAPVSGKVVEVNDPLTDAPETINSDPYEEGWMIVIEPTDASEADALMDAKTYREFVEEQE